MFYRTDANDHGLPRDPFKACIVPRPIGWISTVSAGGIRNIAPYSFFNGVASAPPMVMFASNGDQPHGAKDSLANAEETGEFVASLATWDLRNQMNLSCAPLEPSADEFEFAGIETLPSRLVKPERVKGSPVHLECFHHTTVDLPSDDGNARNAIVVGRVAGIHIDESLLRDDGVLDVAAARPLARLGYLDYCVVDETFAIPRPPGSPPPSAPSSPEKTPVIDLYTWSTPNGRKASIMLEEVRLPYEVHPVDITKDEQFAPDFLAVSPNNKIPAIVDRETGISMMESGAILLYLADKTGILKPKDGKERWAATEWLMMQMGSVGPMLGQAHHFLKFNRGVSEYAEKRYGGEAARIYGVLDRRLGESAYLAGESYGIADVATWPWIARHEWQEIDLGRFPNVRRWYTEIAGREAVRKGYDVPETGAEIPIP